MEGLLQRVIQPLLDQRRSNETIKDVPTKREENCSNNGIATFHGRAHFVGPTAVQVGIDALHAANIVESKRMFEALRNHWPEYLIEAAGLGTFMMAGSCKTDK